MQARRSLPALALIAVLLISGCTTYKAVNQASKMVVVAGEAHADYLAPFEYTLAQEYYFEAQRQIEQSDFKSALKFARLSLEASAEALSIAQKEKSEMQEGAQ